MHSGPCNPHWQSALGKEDGHFCSLLGHREIKGWNNNLFLSFNFNVCSKILILEVLISSPDLTAALWKQKCNIAQVHGVRVYPAKEGLGGTLCSCTQIPHAGHPHYPNLTMEQELIAVTFSLIGWVSLPTTAYILLCCRSEGLYRHLLKNYPRAGKLTLTQSVMQWTPTKRWPMSRTDHQKKQTLQHNSVSETISNTFHVYIDHQKAYSILNLFHKHWWTPQQLIQMISCRAGIAVEREQGETHL